MAERVYIDLLEYAQGLYAKALQLLEPGQCDDFSIISGSLILMVGLEKLTKSCIYKINPLMILIEKPDFEQLLKHTQGNKFENHNTISFDKALDRIVKLFPRLNIYKNDIQSIIEQRNLLMHNFGYLEIGDLEKKIQIKVADFTEAICRECFSADPQNIIGQETWVKLQRNRDAYKQAEVLDLETRINHLKRLLAQGQSLPCSPVLMPEDSAKTSFDCPVCGNKALVAFYIDWDLDVDHREGVVLSAYPYAIPIALKCDCGFKLNDYEEVEIVLKDKYGNLCDEVIRQLYGDIVYEDEEREDGS